MGLYAKDSAISQANIPNKCEYTKRGSTIFIYQNWAEYHYQTCLVAGVGQGMVQKSSGS